MDLGCAERLHKFLSLVGSAGDVGLMDSNCLGLGGPSFERVFRKQTRVFFWECKTCTRRLIRLPVFVGDVFCIEVFGVFLTETTRWS